MYGNYEYVDIKNLGQTEAMDLWTCWRSIIINNDAVVHDLLEVRWGAFCDNWDTSWWGRKVGLVESLKLKEDHEQESNRLFTLSHQTTQDNELVSKAYQSSKTIWVHFQAQWLLWKSFHQFWHPGQTTTQFTETHNTLQRCWVKVLVPGLWCQHAKLYGSMIDYRLGLTETYN